jgi:NAD(P)-dependent dehydrogenase (short-subunit alcohol dehydrogenase family)
MLLENQVAIVTGAARGIGRAIAGLFLEEGARLVVGDIKAFPADDPLRAHGDRFIALPCDVARDEEVKALVDTAMGQFGRVDVLVNNAAYPGPLASIMDIAPEEFDHAVAVVLRSVFSGIRHAAPVMIAQGSGSIINIGSTAGLRASSVLHPYGAAKAGVQMLTQSAAVELGGRGVRVNCICPGGISTALYGITAGLDPDAAEAVRDTVARNLAGLQPLNRAGAPEEVATTALWLASDMSSYVTGQVIAVDGGLTVARPMPPGVQPIDIFRKMAGLDANPT